MGSRKNSGRFQKNKIDAEIYEIKTNMTVNIISVKNLTKIKRLKADL